MGYGTLLWDISNFLKHRFRLTGEGKHHPDIEGALNHAFREGSRSVIETAFDSLQEDPAILGFGYLVDHLTRELEILSRLSQQESVEIMNGNVFRLRDLCRAWLRSNDREQYDKYFDQRFQDADVPP